MYWYDTSKNELKGDRYLTHLMAALRGKQFVHFLALILYADLQRKVKRQEKKSEKTIEQMFSEMRKVRIVKYALGTVMEESLTRKKKYPPMP